MTDACTVGAKRSTLASETRMDLSGYTLEPLHEDGERILYRGVHQGMHGGLRDAAHPTVLVAGLSGEYASPTTLARLQHEYALAGELDPRWAVRPMALLRHQGRTLVGRRGHRKQQA